MVKSAIDGKMKESADMQKNAIKLIASLFSDVNPIPIKTAMAYLSMCGETMRLPLSPMTSLLREKLIDEINNSKSILY